MRNIRFSFGRLLGFMLLLTFMLLLAGCANADGTPGPNPVPMTVLAFFEGTGAVELGGIVVGALVAVFGALGVQFNLFNWVKLRFKASGLAAGFVVYATAWVVAAILGLVTGDVNLGLYSLTLTGIMAFGNDVFVLANTVFVGSQIWYLYLYNKDEKPAPQVVSYTP